MLVASTGSIPVRDEITEDIMMRNQKLTLENELLRRERDEARRLYCEEWAFTIELERGEASDPRDLANEKKWDCYKGAESNGHLEAIRNLFKETRNEQ